MASRTEMMRNNVRAGVFVTISLLLALGVVITLTGALESLLTRVNTYTVRFKVADGVSDIQPGSEVRVGGVALGSVHSIEPVIVPDEPLEEIEIVFGLSRSTPLYTGADIYVKAPLIGSGAWLDITDVGDADGTMLGETDVIPGAAGSLLSSVLGSETEGIFEKVGTFTNFLGTVPTTWNEKVEPTLDNVQAASEDIRALTARVNDEDWPRWSARVTGVLDWAGGATEELDAVFDNGNALLVDMRGVVDENREDIRVTVGNAREFSEDARAVGARVNDEMMDKFDRLVDTGQSALDEAGATFASIRRDYDGWTSQVDEMVANFALTSQQLKLGAIEVRRSPWKLLYRPDDPELEHELLYEAARSFALASADLKAATRSVERIVERHGDALMEDPSSLQRMEQNLRRSFEKYEAAQKDLFEVLVSSP